MRWEEFEQYLREVVGYGEGTVRSRASNCYRVEMFEGDLDEHYEKDGLQSLLNRLCYSTVDEREGRPPRHFVPINGNVRNGTATLKNAVSLYLDFRNGVARDRSERRSSSGWSTVRAARAKKTQPWPSWPQPDEGDSWRLARILTRYIRFLSPAIVESIAKDNDARRYDWYGALASCGVDPSLYLWEGSPCAFPGVRRFAGSREIAHYRKIEGAGEGPDDALSLDDNDCPKQVWSFVFRNAQFAKFGPAGYRLAHLVDHKEHNNRMAEDLKASDEALLRTLPGLYTCPSNTAYVLASLLLPTDFNALIRNLILRRAFMLYKDCCNMFPPGLSVPSDCSEGWELDAFEWPEPVGDTGYMVAFLRFREKRMSRLIEQAQRRGAPGRSG